MNDNTKITKLISAFQKDGYNVDRVADVFNYQGATGIQAFHKTAKN